MPSDYENCPFEAEISILLTNDNEIGEINRQFRNQDKPTDALSFPAIEFGMAEIFRILMIRQ